MFTRSCHTSWHGYLSRHVFWLRSPFTLPKLKAQWLCEIR